MNNNNNKDINLNNHDNIINKNNNNNIDKDKNKNINSNNSNSKDNNNNNNYDNNIINEICNEILVKEIEWWRNDIKKEQIDQLIEYGYNPINLLFFGELTFTIKGIKPITLISEFSDSGLNQSYINKVLKVALDKLQFIGYYLIDQLETSNCNFTNCLIIYNKNNQLYNQFNQLIKSSINNSINNNNNIILNLKEDQLSKLLDYPFSLPEYFNINSADNSGDSSGNNDQDQGIVRMMDIGFESQNKIIMSYYCSFNQLKSNRGLIEDHFKKYLNKFKETFLNSDLNLKVSFIS